MPRSAKFAEAFWISACLGNFDQSHRTIASDDCNLNWQRRLKNLLKRCVTWNHINVNTEHCDYLFNVYKLKQSNVVINSIKINKKPDHTVAQKNLLDSTCQIPRLRDVIYIAIFSHGNMKFLSMKLVPGVATGMFLFGGTFKLLKYTSVMF